jgi:protein ImuB
MAFASIFVPNFLVQAVVRSEPALDAHVLAVVEGPASIQTVVGVNELGAKAGIRLGMTKSQARQFGATEIRLRSLQQEKSAHAALLDLGWAVSPRVEDFAEDTIVLDISGLSSIFGPEKQIARRLAEAANRLGLSVQIAVASNLDSAVLASRAFTGITVIPSSREAVVIGRAPVAALRPPAKVLETFERWGVHTCAALAALPVLQLSERLGQEGVRLHARSLGCGTRSLVPAHSGLCFEEEMELEEAVVEIEPLAFLVGRVLSRLCARLTERSLAAAAIRLRFELDPERDRLLRESPSIRELQVYERTLRLPVPMRDSQLLLKLLILQWRADPPLAPIVKLALAADPARPRVSQGSLFSPIYFDPEKTELTVARLAKVVGSANLGSPELLDTHRPDSFQMRRFFPDRDLLDAQGSSRSRHGRGAAKSGNLPVQPLKTAFRVFRPALPAKVELRNGCPARMTFSGRRCRVVEASGIWHTLGDWWKEDAWQYEEWDLEVEVDSKREKSIEGLGAKGPRIYRVRFDRIADRWSIEGMYD